MQYRYAQTADAEIVDVLDLSCGLPRSRGQFSCLSCRRDLVPVLGLRREKHFRYRYEGEAPCSRETYLHALAKNTIITGFRAAVRSGEPYNLTLPVENHCSRWKDELDYICERPKGRRDIDLTRHFDRIQEEAAIKGFIADILLTSSKSDKHLLIEVAVTHRCEQSKISSRLRIVEVAVPDEDRCRRLSSGIDTRAENVQTHNLKRLAPQEVSCTPNCGAELSAFFVFRSGKTRFLTETPEQITVKRKHPSTIYSRVLEPYTFVEHLVATGGYREEALRALRADIPVKCCYLCRYVGLDAWEKAVFCKVWKTDVGVNEAATCTAYRPER